MRFRNQTKEDIATLFQLVRAAEHKVETLRDEMAAEFVKNNKKTSDHQAETSAKLAEIDKRLEKLERTPTSPELTLFPVESCSSFPKNETSKTPEKAADWVNGVEAAKMLGWQTCSSEKLLRARISFRQAAKNKPLSVNVKSVKDYIARRKSRRRETSGK